ncbi:MAG: GGDEF domain-containing protein [Labilithrix sp.]|nr:GGDEF domain-containing protein [Labilithrix sp.]
MRSALREDHRLLDRLRVTLREKDEGILQLEACKLTPSALGAAAIFFDLDHFKRLNTALTEREVDRSILPQIHRCIRDATAQLGFAYAEGGDEFVVLLPNANEAIAVAAAEALRAAIARLTLTATDGTRHRVTASFGVAVSDVWGIDELPDAANTAKATAKAEGRDRVIVARR